MPTLAGDEPSPLVSREAPLRLSIYGAIGANGDLEAELQKVAAASTGHAKARQQRAVVGLGTHGSITARAPSGG